MDLFFSQTLQTWYAKNGRKLPWRDTQNPYLIWLSEIILQQTRVTQGYPYYQRFVDRFPDVKSLAAASEDEVLRLWQGLGYYTRARNLLHAAQIIAQKGSFPIDYKEVRALPGIGEYTAAAICSFAFGTPVAVVDGNVLRVLARLFGVETPIDTTQGKQQLKELAQNILDPTHPGMHNQAIMDFGALQCKPAAPDCTSCPFAANCMAHTQGRVEQLPAHQRTIKVRTRHFCYFFVCSPDAELLHRRSAKDIWQGLYEPPLVELPTSAPSESALENDAIHELLTIKNATLTTVRLGLTHRLTHQLIIADFYRITLPQMPHPLPHLLEDCVVVRNSDIAKYAQSALVTTIRSHP
jgi:A/G-specific adenine glycosylase